MIKLNGVEVDKDGVAPGYYISKNANAEMFPVEVFGDDVSVGYYRFKPFGRAFKLSGADLDLYSNVVIEVQTKWVCHYK